MKRAIISIIFSITVISMKADTIFVKPEDQNLIDRIRSEQTEPSKADVIAAATSSNALVQLAGFKVILNRREFEVWKELRSQIIHPKGTCGSLAIILDHLSKFPPANDRSLMSALKPDQLDLMSSITKAEPPRYEDSEPPVDAVLYEILAKDLGKPSIQNEDRKQSALILGKYRAPTKQLGESVLKMGGVGVPNPAE